MLWTIKTICIAGCCVLAGMLELSSSARGDDSVPEVAFVGVAHIHTPDFVERISKRHDVKVKYVWDEDPQRAKQYADQLKVPVAQSVEQILSDPQIKAVIICSETNRHLKLVTAAAKAKKDIYAEKPLGMQAEDAYAMAKAIREAGVKFQTGYFMRGEPALQFLKEQVEKGSFGTITRIRGVNTHNGALGGWFDHEYRWMADPKQAGIGGYGDLGTHSLDLMLWLMDQPVTKVTAVTSMGTNRYGCDELGEGVLQFKGGAIGTLGAGWDDVAADPVSLEIAGTQGQAAIVNGRLYFQSSKVQGSSMRRPVGSLPAQQPHPFEIFLDSVTGKNEKLIGADEAAYRCAVMDALYQGAKESKWVDVQQPPAQ